uniref:Fibrinogen C-terminal domain-containing protein n=1 Tax=Neogobius melanostomus TaxID=47308 RepID=A0A8C6TXT6_9GOBI
MFFTGLEFIHRITARRPQELLVEMEDFEGNKASARYSSFSVGGECDGYKLTVSGFTDGGAGDSLRDHNNMKFSTFDKDQDTSASTSCAKKYLGAFWYSNCHDANPNGVYRWGADNSIHAVGVEWETFKGNDYSLKSISFKTRPVQ